MTKLIYWITCHSQATGIESEKFIFLHNSRLIKFILCFWVLSWWESMTHWTPVYRRLQVQSWLCKIIRSQSELIRTCPWGQLIWSHQEFSVGFVCWWGYHLSIHISTTVSTCFHCNSQSIVTAFFLLGITSFFNSHNVILKALYTYVIEIL